MMTIRSHFDGRVFVPDEPVSLPTNQRVEVRVADPIDNRQRTDKLPVFHPPPGTPTLRSEDVYAAEDEA